MTNNITFRGGQYFLDDKPIADPAGAPEAPLSLAAQIAELTRDPRETQRLSEAIGELSGLSVDAIRRRQTEFIAAGDGFASALARQLINDREATFKREYKAPTPAAMPDEDREAYLTQIESYKQHLRFLPEDDIERELYTNLITEFEHRLNPAGE